MKCTACFHTKHPRSSTPNPACLGHRSMPYIDLETGSPRHWDMGWRCGDEPEQAKPPAARVSHSVVRTHRNPRSADRHNSEPTCCCGCEFGFARRHSGTPYLCCLHISLRDTPLAKLFDLNALSLGFPPLHSIPTHYIGSADWDDRA